MQVNIMLTGTFGVGKSALFDRLLFDRFESLYQGTLGVRTNHKTIRNKGQIVRLQLWDIAGEVDQKRVPLSYFQDKDMILYLVDLSRLSSCKNAVKDLEFLKIVTKEKTMVKIIGTKKDLAGEADLERFRRRIAPLTLDLTVSAKTGQNLHSLSEVINGFLNEKLLWENPKQSTSL